MKIFIASIIIVFMCNFAFAENCEESMYTYKRFRRAYNDLDRSYKDIGSLLEKENPKLKSEIDALFVKARKILGQWRTYSNECDLSKMDILMFRAIIRQIQSFLDPFGEYKSK